MPSWLLNKFIKKKKKKKHPTIVCAQDPNMFGKCNKYSKRIGLKNIIKKQFMIFFFDFPLRWYKIFGSINKYQGPISGILIYFPRIRIPIIFYFTLPIPLQTKPKPYQNLKNPISKPPIFTQTQRERITQQWLSQSSMPFTAPHSTLRKGIWGPNSQSSHLRSSGNWDFKFLSFSRSFLS